MTNDGNNVFIYLGIEARALNAGVTLGSSSIVVQHINPTKSSEGGKEKILYSFKAPTNYVQQNYS